jgi:hypothetical protein
MSKKAQLASTIILYILLVMIIGFTLALSIKSIQSFKKTGQRVEMQNLVSTLENSIKNQKIKGKGSIESITLSTPSNIETVCFVDSNELFSPRSFMQLTKEKEIYPDKNVFFFPSEKFAPSKIKGIKLKESENPLCIKSVNNKLNLKLTTEEDSTLLESVSQQDIKKNCIIVPGSTVGDSNKKIDIVFLGFNYNDKQLFAQDVDDYTNNYLFQIEPFSTNKEKFNIWMIDEQSPDCSITNYIFCDSLSVNKIASNCPNDYVFILADKNNLRNSIRSSAVSNLAKINTNDNKLVLLHEFSHIFAGLADEYTDRYYNDWFDAKNYPNCDYQECPSWSGINNTDCIKGCSTNEFFRSIKTSIMRNYDKSNEFGVINQQTITKQLEAYK